ncbi:hypothetical protein [Caulobacter sp. S45]|uniref:hypothetical protein n=1 Tax=Caulobacter sp. S45 TaxID=1641861 RepID=UPI001C2D42A4|nr:hypothetical protein [Caulobacter sp. S45]
MQSTYAGCSGLMETGGVVMAEASGGGGDGYPSKDGSDWRDGVSDAPAATRGPAGRAR